MKQRFVCDRCETGNISRYGHVDNGVCWKCGGTGFLNYDPAPRGEAHTDDRSYLEFLEAQRFAEEEQQAQHDAWKAANNMFEDESENYYHG